MATSKKYDLAVVVGSYPDPQTGVNKNRYQNIGTVLEKDDGGKFILLDPLINLAAIPRGQGRDMIMVSMFEPKENNQGQQSAPQNSQPQNNDQPYPVCTNGQWQWSNGQPMNPQEVQFYQNQAGQRR